MIRLDEFKADALMYYLGYEKEHGRKHPEWEQRIKSMLESFLRLQNEDGSFPRKFKNDYSIVDKSGGSTPSATLPLIMASRYFKDKRYLTAAKRSVDYLEKELISKSDYFSSTLDANCEDKEASLYGSTAAYYLALATKAKNVPITPPWHARPPISPSHGITPGTCLSHRDKCWATSD